MSPENFSKAVVLMPKIKDVQQQIDRWERAESFKSSTIDCNFQSRDYSYVSTKHIPFEIVKLLSIDAFKKELVVLQKELDSL